MKIIKYIYWESILQLHHSPTTPTVSPGSYVFFLYRVMLVVPLLNSSLSILVWRSSCVSDLAQTDSTFHRYENSDMDFCD
jgi:hypothetical protein